MKILKPILQQEDAPKIVQSIYAMQENKEVYDQHTIDIAKEKYPSWFIKDATISNFTQNEIPF